MNNNTYLVGMPYVLRLWGCTTGFTSQITMVIHTACEHGDVRLVTGTSRYEGRVEFCYGYQWGTICDEDWGDEEARVVCAQLKFPAYGKLTKRCKKSENLISTEMFS